METKLSVMTPKEIARDIVWEHARSVDYLSVVEYLADEYPAMLAHVRAELALRVHGLIHEADMDVMVEWPV
jgi:hypothetical protein